jgi:hypothetical protein
MSTLEVNTINPQSGSTITLGSSGNTVALGSGVSGSGFGKIGQVVTTTFTGTESASTGNGTYTDSSVYASITPSSTSSKIMVMATINSGASTSSDGAHVGRFVQIIGGTTTPVFIGDTAGSRQRLSIGRGNESQGPSTILTNGCSFLISPSTTSEVTVKYQFGSRSSGNTYINRTHNDNSTSAGSRTASAITLMEVLA